MTKFKFNPLAANLKQGTITQKEVVAEIQELAKENPFEAKGVVKRVKY